MKSTVKKISEININMEETIKALMIDRSALEMHIRRLTHLFKNDTQQQIEQKLRNILARDNIFNVIMNEVARSYEVTFDGDEIKNTAKQLEQHFQGRDPKVVEEIAKKAITKSLIFGEIAKEWNITVSDQEVDDSLEQYYKFSNEPIRPFKEDKAKFENIRSAMLEEKIVNELMRRFSKVRLDYEAIQRQFQEIAERQAATKKQQEEAQQKEKNREFF